MISEAEARVSYYRARYYDPQAGRFISQDATMSGTNFYTYVGGNVTGYVDPFGYQRNQRLLAACAADASLNFGLGFVPGYNFLKLGLGVFHISVNPFQAAGGFAPLVQLPETAAGFAAGISSGYDAYAKSAFALAGGQSGYQRAVDLASRNSFGLKTAAQQEKILSKLANLSKLRNIASAAGTVANLLNVVDYAITLHSCWEKSACD